MRCWLNVAIERVCSHGAEVQRQREPCEGHASCVCLYAVFGVVSWTGGASRCPRALMMRFLAVSA
jgi:hypothetical protein